MATADGGQIKTEISVTLVSDEDDCCSEELSSDDGDCSAEEEPDSMATSAINNYHCDNGSLMAAAMGNDVTAQLAAAGWQKQHLHGPVGMAAAAAIVSSKKRKRPHSFETNPSIRKRQQNRLIRKLRQTIDEFSTRVGQQAVVLVATPGKENGAFKCFGAKPLEDVMCNLRHMIMEELELALSQHAPPTIPDDPSLYELPPLILDGIPTPVEKMTQAQLRAFIPLMLKYSTGRGKPGWGRDSTRPVWWPCELPWANVRMDARSDQDKQKISWTKALRQIVLNCYKFHGREDLLPVFTEEDYQEEDHDNNMNDNDNNMNNNDPLMLQDDDDNDNPDNDDINQNGGSSGNKIIIIHSPPPSPPSNHQHQLPPNLLSGCTTATTAAAITVSEYTTSTVLQTINNSDGTLSIIQVDPNNPPPVITLPDGTSAHVQAVTLHSTNQGHQHHHHPQTAELVSRRSSSASSETITGDLLSNVNVTEATVNQDGQIILTGQDGRGFPVSVSGILTVPVPASMYQTMVANIQHINNDGTLQLTPMVHVPKMEDQLDTSSSGQNSSERNEIETITVRPHQVITTTKTSNSGIGEPQLLQVISINDPQAIKALTK